MNEIKMKQKEKALKLAHDLAQILNGGDLGAAYRVLWDNRRQLPVITHKGSINYLQLKRDAVQAWFSRNTDGWWLESYNNEVAITFI